MADAEHLSRLREGVAKWNRWRKATKTVPDLADVDLRYQDLAGANLTKP
jgi:hypothetical protein